MGPEIEKMALDKLSLNEPLIEEAEYHFVKSILCDKSNCYSFYNYGSFLHQLKRYDLAEQCFLECLRINTTFYPALKEVNFFLFFLFFLIFIYVLFYFFKMGELLNKIGSYNDSVKFTNFSKIFANL